MNIGDILNLLIGLFALANGLTLYVLFWMLFQRAKKPGWKALIPFYNLYVMGEIATKKKLGLASAVVNFLTIVIISQSFIRDQTILNLLMVVAVVLYITLFVEFVRKYDKQYKRWLIVPFVPVVGLFYIKSAKNYHSS